MQNFPILKGELPFSLPETNPVRIVEAMLFDRLNRPFNGVPFDMYPVYELKQTMELQHSVCVNFFVYVLLIIQFDLGYFLILLVLQSAILTCQQLVSLIFYFFDCRENKREKR